MRRTHSLATAFCLVTAVGLASANELAARSVVINEIHYEPEDKKQAHEFVELVNTGETTVDLSGWFFSAPISRIKRGNIEEWMAWAFFHSQPHHLSATGCSGRASSFQKCHPLCAYSNMTRRRFAATHRRLDAVGDSSKQNAWACFARFCTVAVDSLHLSRLGMKIPVDVPYLPASKTYTLPADTQTSSLAA